MKCCTFFGHHDCPDTLKEKILAAIKAQIAAGTTSFYVGNQGHFDRMALSCLRKMKEEYPDLTYAVVLAYLPTEPDLYEPDETVLPEGIETVPKRFAIDFRNRWMIDHADTVIAYVTHSWGGAAKHLKSAEKKGKTIINLADDPAVL